MATIQAAVSSKILSKVDRLFSNTLSDIFIELLQNARRAGADLVEVSTEPIKQGTRITLIDNGEGIPDFRVLLHLGDSNWDADTSDKEDPAGMGFFSLLHSGVTVRSRGQQAVITKAGFLGHQPVQTVDCEGPERGTVLLFDRAEPVSGVEETLQRAARYGDLEVRLNGKTLAREDFLEGALFIKEVAGVRIGIHTNYYRADWNFHGRVIEGRHHLPSLSRAAVNNKGERCDLYVRVDVKEARYIHLKLPDRTAIVQDDSYTSLCREAKIVLYEYLASLPEHTAKFSDFVEAGNLGVALREASPWFKTFYQSPAWIGTDEDFFPAQSSVIATAGSHAIVEREEESADLLAFTFLIALEHFHKLPVVPIEDALDYEGYTWYGSIPRLRGFGLTIDGKPLEEGEDSSPVLRFADSIQLSFVLVRGEAQEGILWDLPFAGFKEVDWNDQAALVIGRSSPWAAPASEEARPPFDLLDAAIYIAFSPSDDCEADSSDTQLDFFRDNAESEIIRVLGGTLARAKHALHEALFGWRTDVSGFLRESNVSEIHLRKSQTGVWESEFVTSASPSTS